MMGWAIEALLASAVLMAVVLAIRGPVRRSFGSGAAYALWMLPAARLFLPYLPGNWQLSRLVAPVVRQVEQAPGFVVGVMNPATLPPAAVRHAVTAGVRLGHQNWQVAVVPPTTIDHGAPIAAIAMGVWIAGAALFLVWQSVAHRLFCRRLLAGASLIARRDGIRVIAADAARGPLAFGIVRRYVAFPRDFDDRYDADERALALAHEIGHHQRGDLIANWVALAVLALHWFNPLAWRAFRVFRADQEMANDARVLAGRSLIDRHTYACAIIKAAHGGAVSAACHLHTIHDLKGRLKMLTTGRRSRLRRLAGGTAVSLVVIGGLAATASGSASVSTARAGVERATGVDFAALDHRIAARLQRTPTPPATPEGAVLPSSPLLPAAIAAPASPAAPAAPSPLAAGTEAGRTVKRIKVIQMDKDGKVLTETATDMPDIPEVRSSDCGVDRSGKAGAGAVVVNRQEGGKRFMIVCTDRIETMSRVAVDGQRMAESRMRAAGVEQARAADYRRMAYGKALDGLRNARDQVAANGEMSAKDKALALSSIDESIRELEGDLAKAD